MGMQWFRHITRNSVSK